VGGGEVVGKLKRDVVLNGDDVVSMWYRSGEGVVKV